LEYSMIIFLLLIAVIIPAIERRKRTVLIKHIIDKKKNSKEKNVMKELAKQFIGKECIIYTVTKYSLQGTTQSRYLTGGPPVRFSM